MTIVTQVHPEWFMRTKFNYSKNKAKDATGDCRKD